MWNFRFDKSEFWPFFVVKESIESMEGFFGAEGSIRKNRYFEISEFEGPERMLFEKCRVSGFAGKTIRSESVCSFSQLPFMLLALNKSMA